MADPQLVQTLDYILNRCDEASIEAVAEAVVRRRRDFSISSVGNIPDPRRMASEITEKFKSSLGGIDSIKKSIREMMVRIISENAPELTKKQVNELCKAWLPDENFMETENKNALPKDVLISMIEQFISFSSGTMKKSTDESLRTEMGAWPERYWKAFPPVIRQLITDYLKNNITGDEFNSRIGIALDLKR